MLNGYRIDSGNMAIRVYFGQRQCNFIDCVSDITRKENEMTSEERGIVGSQCLDLLTEAIKKAGGRSEDGPVILNMMAAAWIARYAKPNETAESTWQIFTDSASKKLYQATFIVNRPKQGKN